MRSPWVRRRGWRRRRSGSIWERWRAARWGCSERPGSGKTFLARMLLAGLVKEGEAVSLVFDMESEYGWQGQDNDRRRQVKGLKQLFPSRVVTFTLDEESSRRRGVTPDGVVRIGYDEIEPADIEVLRDLC